MDDPARVLFDYFERIDAHDPVGAVAFFTDDAKAEVMTGKFLEGRDRIGRALGRILAAYERTSHHVTNLRWDRDGDRIVLWSYVYAHHRMKATGAAWHLWVRLRNVLVEEDGKLRIAEHQLVAVDSIPGRKEIPADWYPGHPGREWPALPEPGQRLREAIEAASPQVAHGMEHMRRAAAESALGEARSALVTACAAAARDQLETVLAALARAEAAGLPPEQAWATPGALLIARGDVVAQRLARGLLETFGAPPAGEPHDGSIAREDAVAHFREYFGDELPERVALLADRMPTAFAGYALMHRGALRGAALPPKLAELVLCGLNAAEYQSEYVAIHAAAARRVGASEDEILGAVLAAVPVAGVAAWASAAGVLV